MFKTIPTMKIMEGLWLRRDSNKFLRGKKETFSL